MVSTRNGPSASPRLPPRRGDVILLENQACVCGLACDYVNNTQYGFGPTEYWQPVFDATATATSLGIVVVAAAGNGNVDLDDVRCGGRFDRSIRDSGAIIVGAGDSTSHGKRESSSYGSRVDLQGWGHDVVTTGYGDLFDPGDIRQRYRRSFAGTSAASPIVAGAVLSVQGMARAAGLPPLSPERVRALLVATGTPQGSGDAGHIGPLPNLPAAARELLHTAPAVPLVRQASHPVQQGFIRIINHSGVPGTARITGIDDAGTEYGPIVLQLEPRATRNVNSGDLENGNPAKGLSGGLGVGDGDWRLRVSSTLDIEVLSYVRTEDGFVTTMKQVVPARAMRHHVPFFNPGDNRSQVSSLRLMNSADEHVEVTILGRDDAGEPAPGGSVRITLPAREAHTIDAQELESGGSDLRGQLGAGTGKWQLFVAADRPIQVMNLLRSPTGHLSNLSAPGRAGDQGDGEPCDPSLICGAALTCVDGLLYPSACGPDNCDLPIDVCLATE